MARSNAIACIHNTHKMEGSFTKSGGWTINPNDPGNWTGGRKGVGQLKGTKYGIAANTYPKLDIRNLTLAQADAIYVRDYWPKAWGNDWPEGFDQITYDATVNSGPGRGPLWTCRALGFPKADRAAVKKAQALSTDGKVAAIKKAIAIRMSFLRSLRTFSHFGRGWTNRCVFMEAVSVKMALVAAKIPGKTVVKKLEKEASKADATAKSQTGAAGGAAAGGGSVTADPSVVGADTVVSSDWMLWLQLGFGVALAAVVVFIAYRAYVNMQRKKAYLDAAAA